MYRVKLCQRGPHTCALHVKCGEYQLRWKFHGGGVKLNGENQSWTPCRESPLGQNPSILKCGENSRGWVKISWGKSKGEPLLGVTPALTYQVWRRSIYPFFRYLADKREMPYLAMLRKVEKWSWIQIRNPVKTKMLPHPDGHPSPHLPSLVDTHGHVRELTCS